MRIEHWFFKLPLTLKSIFRRARVESELDEELGFHLEHKIEEGIAEGLAPEQARDRALRAMGGLEQRKEEIRDARGIHWLTDFLDDVRYALRGLRRAPGLASVVVVTIALGIGMTATPFSMLDALVFRPYPVPHPGEVVTLVGTTRDNAFSPFSDREYRDLRDHTKSFAGVIANTPIRTVGFSASAGTTPVVRGGMLVSGNFFRVLGVEPTLGRGFRDDEDVVPGRDAVAVLGPDFWKNEFGKAASVVGRTIRLNGRDFTVVGVAPESFSGLSVFDRPDVYVPLAMMPAFSRSPGKDFFRDRDDRGLMVRGRLARGVSLRDARQDVAALAKSFERDDPATNRHRGATVRTMIEMRTQAGETNWKFGAIFTALALAVLLVACTNAAGLLLSRARTRTREIAVRLAIGAGRGRLVRLLLTESLVLAVLGGVLGIAVGYAGISALQTFSIPTEIPVQIPFRMDTRVLLVSLALSVLSALACGLVPALQSTRGNLVTGLKLVDGDATRERRRPWGRNALVVAQVAMSLMLLAAACLMYRGFRRYFEHGLDFAGQARRHVLMVRFDTRLVQYDEAQSRRFFEALTDRLREQRGVAGAALTQNPPLGLEGFGLVGFVPEDFVMPPDRERFTSSMDTVDEGYFETMGVPILRGRSFRPSDTATTPKVAVVSEHFARHYWPDKDPIGRRFRLDGAQGEPVEIVGIAKTIKYGDTTEREADFVYLPFAQRPQPRMVLLVKSEDKPLPMVEIVQDVVRRLDPNMPLLETRTYEELYRYSAVYGPGVAIKLVGTLGAVGLLLAIAGLYGLVAYNVARRTREIGIRIAIGARSRDVLRLVMGNGLWLVLIGTAIGLAMGVGLERLLNATIFGASGVDFLVYLVVIPTMVLVATFAAWIPARRACRIPPTLALRAE
jgi:predicted permease